MTPTDRRGLGEIVAWCTMVVMLGGVVMVAMLRDPQAVPYVMGPFLGLVAALASRGTKGAIDRDALRERSSAPPGAAGKATATATASTDGNDPT